MTAVDTPGAAGDPATITKHHQTSRLGVALPPLTAYEVRTSHRLRNKTMHRSASALQNGHVVRHLDLAAGTAAGSAAAAAAAGCPLSGSMGHLPPPNLIGDSGGFLTR